MRLKHEDIIRLLKEHFDEIKTTVVSHGRWYLPEVIQKKLESKVSPKQLNIIRGQAEINESGKSIFKQSNLLLEQFCLLKIYELAHILKIEEAIQPHSKIRLALLERASNEDKQPIAVTEVTIFFSENHIADSIKSSTSDAKSTTFYDHIVDALQNSSWAHSQIASTTLRFADHPIEENLVIQQYCKHIDYVSISDSLPKTLPSEANFWEHYAVKRKKSVVDYENVEIITKKLSGIEHSKKKVVLSTKIQKVADQYQGEIDQANYVKKIINIQRAGLGSLLYLPTGAGKTFIILMAMAQHYHELDKSHKKPCFVVTYNVNVLDSWEENIELFKHMYEDQVDAKMEYPFGEKFSYIRVDNTDEFLGKIKTNQLVNYHLILCGSDILANSISKLIATEKKPLIKNYLASLLLGHSQILLGDNLIIDPNTVGWKEKIKTTLGYACTTPESCQNAYNIITNDEESDPNYEGYNAKFFRQLSNRRDYEQRNNTHTDDEKADSFDHFHQFYQIYESVKEEQLVAFNALRNKNPEEAFESYFTDGKGRQRIEVSQSLEPLILQQKESNTRYLQFVNQFSGLILDESQSVLVDEPSNASKPKGITANQIVQDMSRHFQSQNSPGNRNNTLIISASATPWPNSLSEMRLQFEFIGTGIIANQIGLHRELFQYWQQLETQLKQTNKKKANHQILSNKLKAIMRYLAPWVRTLFKTLVVHEHANGQQSNNISEQFLHIECDQGFKVIESNNEMQTIDNFYTSLIGVPVDAFEKSAKNIKKSKTFDEDIDTVFNDQKTTVALTKILQTIEVAHAETRYPYIAFFISTKKTAIYFKAILQKFYVEKLGNPDIEIGLFFERNFVKNQYEREGNPINRDTKLNRSAFNHEFDLISFNAFLKERLNISKDPYFTGSSKSLVIQYFIEPFLHLIHYITSKDSKEPINKLKTQPQKKYLNDDKLSELYSFCFENRMKYDSSSKLDPVEKAKEKIINDVKNKFKDSMQKFSVTFIEFIFLLFKFEQESKQKPLKLTDNNCEFLRQFYVFLPKTCAKKSQLECKEEDILSSYARFFNQYVEEQIKKQKKLDKCIMKSIIYSVLYYIQKMNRSRVLIFGPAGTTGMRADADFLILLSAAWNLGKRIQIIGRVGRNKAQNRGRPCKVYAPITNTYFEMYILKYYVCKKLYDDFVTDETKIDANTILTNLILAYRLYSLYKDNSESIISDLIFKKIGPQVSQQVADDYFTKPPYEKALYLIEEKVLQEIDDEIAPIDFSELKYSSVQEVLDEELENNSPEGIFLPMQGIESSTLKNFVTLEEQYQSLTSETEEQFVEDKVEVMSQPVSELETHTTLKRNTCVAEIDFENKSTKFSTKKVKSDPNVSSDVEVTMAQSKQSPPKILSLFDPIWKDKDWEKLQSFYRVNKNQVIVMLPGLAKAPDIELSQFITYLNNAINPESNNLQITLIYGINSTDRNAVMEIAGEQQSQPFQQIYVKCIPFIWYEEDRKAQGRKPPIGQMRNFCLMQVRTLWKKMTSEYQLPENQILLLSMDGDTELTQEAFTYIYTELNKGKNSCVMLCAGYEIKYENDFFPQALEKKHGYTNEKFATTCAIHLSMNICRYMHLLNNTYHYPVSYPSEPCIAINPELLKSLFTEHSSNNFLDASSDHQAIFGWWDNEGRRFANAIKKVSNSPIYIGPSKKVSERPVLHNYTRLMLRKPLPFKQAITKPQLLEVVSCLASQSQSAYRVYFVGSSFRIALCNKNHSKISTFTIRKYASYFYVKTVINLLSLGPLRINIFCKYLKNILLGEKLDVDIPGAQSTFEISHERLNHFISSVFSEIINQKYCHDFFIMAITWLNHCADQLQHYFCKYYIGERDEKKIYTPMLVPPSYPHCAESLAQEEEKQLSLLSPLSEDEFFENSIEKNEEIIDEQKDIEVVPEQKKIIIGNIENQLIKTFSYKKLTHLQFPQCVQAYGFIGNTAVVIIYISKISDLLQEMQTHHVATENLVSTQSSDITALLTLYLMENQKNYELNYKYSQWTPCYKLFNDTTHQGFELKSVLEICLSCIKQTVEMQSSLTHEILEDKPKIYSDQPVTQSQSERRMATPLKRIPSTKYSFFAGVDTKKARSYPSNSHENPYPLSDKKKMEFESSPRSLSWENDLADITNRGIAIGSQTWATDNGITTILSDYFDDRVHVLKPNLAPGHNIFSDKSEEAEATAIEITKFIAGYSTEDDSVIDNGIIAKDGRSLSLPIVWILNTDCGAASLSPAYFTKVQGRHWVTLVILPRFFQPRYGAALNNQREQIVLVDSQGPRAMPNALRNALAGTEPIQQCIRREEDKPDVYHTVTPPFPQATISDNHQTYQQKGGSDCGWWAVYNAIQVIETGKVAPVKFTTREPAFYLRHCMPQLDHTEVRERHFPRDSFHNLGML